MKKLLLILLCLPFIGFGQCISGNCENGYGKYTYLSGNYVGEWKDNMMHGQGTYTFADGRKYTGEFKDNMIHGQGTWFNAEGTSVKGLWENGEFIKSSATNINGLKNNGQKMFDVINHPKSKGLNFSIKEPAEFERVDRKGGNVLYHWIKNRDDLTNEITISILIKELPKKLQLSKEEMIKYLKFEDGISDFSKLYKNVTKEKYIVIDSYPGFILNCIDFAYEKIVYTKAATVFVEGKAVSLFMSSFESESKLELNEEIFISTINSIIFTD